MFELRYQGEVVGWALIGASGCVLEPANEELDALVVHRMRGIVEWLVQAEAFAA